MLGPHNRIEALKGVWKIELLIKHLFCEMISLLNPTYYIITYEQKGPTEKKRFLDVREALNHVLWHLPYSLQYHHMKQLPGAYIFWDLELIWSVL